MSETKLAAAVSDTAPVLSDFFAENLAAFREYAPQIHARLAQVEALHSRIMVDDDGALDIVLGDRRFYGEDAVAFTQRQIDNYFSEPERAFIETLSFNKSVGLEGKYVRALSAVLEAESVELANGRADTASHFTVVFGLGLGLHLEPLIQFTGCAELIVVEPNFDNLYHSLFVIDWRALFDNAAKSGCAIHLVLEKGQVAITLNLRKLIRLGNPALVDGIYVYQHYGSSLMTEAHRMFNRDFSLHILGLGYFEDELVMMANAVGNLKRGNARVLTSQQLPREEPVLICGSGPSIDNDLDVIAAQRDRAIVVSIGSAIRILLAHGIRPDMHVETENHPANADNIVRVAAEFGLSGITLIGAATVQPVMTELFDDVILYFRDSQSPSAVFCNAIEKMGSAGPTVANAALVTLTQLGFRELYLFGVDMGSCTGDQYHSADTYIGRGEADEWAGDNRSPVPANFGGDALAETILNWSRSGIEDVLAMNPVIRCMNCSDGARIAGSIPLLPTILDLSNSPLVHGDIMDDVRSKTPVFPLELTTRFWNECELPAASPGVFAEIDALLATAAAREDPGLTWIYDLYSLIADARTKFPAIGIFLFGTTSLYLGSFWWFDGRIEDVQVRRRFRRAAAGEMRSLYAAMERRLTRLITDTDRCIAGQIEAVDSSLEI